MFGGPSCADDSPRVFLGPSVNDHYDRGSDHAGSPPSFLVWVGVLFRDAVEVLEYQLGGLEYDAVLEDVFQVLMGVSCPSQIVGSLGLCVG